MSTKTEETKESAPDPFGAPDPPAPGDESKAKKDDKDTGLPSTGMPVVRFALVILGLLAFLVFLLVWMVAGPAWAVLVLLGGLAFAVMGVVARVLNKRDAKAAEEKAGKKGEAGKKRTSGKVGKRPRDGQARESVWSRWRNRGSAGRGTGRGAGPRGRGPGGGAGRGRAPGAQGGLRNAFRRGGRDGSTRQQRRAAAQAAGKQTLGGRARAALGRNPGGKQAGQTKPSTAKSPAGGKQPGRVRSAWSTWRNNRKNRGNGGPTSKPNRNSSSSPSSGRPGSGNNSSSNGGGPKKRQKNRGKKRKQIGEWWDWWTERGERDPAASGDKKRKKPKNGKDADSGNSAGDDTKDPNGTAEKLDKTAWWRKKNNKKKLPDLDVDDAGFPSATPTATGKKRRLKRPDWSRRKGKDADAAPGPVEVDDHGWPTTMTGRATTASAPASPRYSDDWPASPPPRQRPAPTPRGNLSTKGRTAVSTPVDVQSGYAGQPQESTKASKIATLSASRDIAAANAAERYEIAAGLQAEGQQLLESDDPSDHESGEGMLAEAERVLNDGDGYDAQSQVYAEAVEVLAN
jgi:hypothetical protein